MDQRLYKMSGITLFARMFYLVREVVVTRKGRNQWSGVREVQLVEQGSILFTSNPFFLKDWPKKT